jgi:hypothetical protein
MDDFVRRYATWIRRKPGLPNVPYRQYSESIVDNLPEECLSKCHKSGPYFHPALMKISENPPDNSCAIFSTVEKPVDHISCSTNQITKQFNEIEMAIHRILLRFPNDVSKFYSSTVNKALGYREDNTIKDIQIAYWIFLVFSEYQIQNTIDFPIRTIGRLLRTSYLMEIRMIMHYYQEEPDRTLFSHALEKVSENRMYECIIKYWGPIIRSEINESEKRETLENLEWNSDDIFLKEVRKIFTVRHLAEVIVEFIENEETVETIKERWNDFGGAFLEAIKTKVEIGLDAVLGEL